MNCKNIEEYSIKELIELFFSLKMLINNDEWFDNEPTSKLVNIINENIMKQIIELSM